MVISNHTSNIFTEDTNTEQNCYKFEKEGLFLHSQEPARLKDGKATFTQMSCLWICNKLLIKNNDNLLINDITCVC